MRGFDQINLKKSTKKSILFELKALSKLIKKDSRKKRFDEPAESDIDDDSSHYDPVKNKNRLITEYMVNYSTNTDQNSNIVAVNPREIQNDIEAEEEESDSVSMMCNGSMTSSQ